MIQIIKRLLIERTASIVFDCWIILLFLFEFIYTISPLDILPESEYGIIGLIDDVIVIFLITLMITRYFYSIYSRHYSLNV